MSDEGDDFESLAREVEALEGVQKLRVAAAAVPRMRAATAATKQRAVTVYRHTTEEVVGHVTIGDVFGGLLKIATIEAEVQDGQRPTSAPCVACGALVAVTPRTQRPMCEECLHPACACGCGRRAPENAMAKRQIARRGGRPWECFSCSTRKMNAASRKMRASRTPEQRSAATRKRSEATRKGQASRTPEQRSETVRKMNAARTPEQRSAAASKGHASRTPEQRSAAARKANAAKTPEQRSETVRKMNAAKRAQKAEAEARSASKENDDGFEIQ